MRGTVVMTAAALSAAIASATSAVAASPSATPAPCAADGATPAPAAIACRINARRAARGLDALRADARLARAAQRYADALGTTGPLTHQLPGGPGPAARIAAMGYGGQARRFDFTEVLGRSSGAAATFDQRVQAWFDDATIRRALLARRFRDVGVGTATSGDTTTYVLVVAGPLPAVKPPKTDRPPAKTPHSRR